MRVLLPLVALSLLLPAAAGVAVPKRLYDDTYYVVVVHPNTIAGVYRESNGCPDFQDAVGSCGWSSRPADEAVDSDEEAYGLATDAKDHGWTYAIYLKDEAYGWTLCNLGFGPPPCHLNIYLP